MRQSSNFQLSAGDQTVNVELHHWHQRQHVPIVTGVGTSQGVPTEPGLREVGGLWPGALEHRLLTIAAHRSSH